MNFQKFLTGPYSRESVQKIVRQVGNDPARLAEVVKIMLEGPYRRTQRMSAVLSYCIERNPLLIKPHFAAVMKVLSHPNASPFMVRNILRLLQFVDIPEKYAGRLAEQSFNYLKDRKTPIAIQVFAMTVLARMARKHPGLSRELVPLIEELTPYSGAGFNARARGVLADLKSQHLSE